MIIQESFLALWVCLQTLFFQEYVASKFGRFSHRTALQVGVQIILWLLGSLSILKYWTITPEVSLSDILIAEAVLSLATYVHLYLVQQLTFFSSRSMIGAYSQRRERDFRWIQAIFILVSLLLLLLSYYKIEMTIWWSLLAMLLMVVTSIVYDKIFREFMYDRYY